MSREEQQQTRALRRVQDERGALVLSILFGAVLGGCQVSRWTQVQIQSDPPAAIVTIAETGNTVSTAGGLIEIRERFGFLEPRRRRFTFVFEKAGRMNDEVPVLLRDWYATRAEAIHEPDPPFIFGLLKPIPSTATEISNGEEEKVAQ